jgi:hypothetical protein
MVEYGSLTFFLCLIDALNPKIPAATGTSPFRQKLRKITAGDQLPIGRKNEATMELLCGIKPMKAPKITAIKAGANKRVFRRIDKPLTIIKLLPLSRLNLKDL